MVAYCIPIALHLMLIYRPFHKTLPRVTAFIKWISVRFYETDVVQINFTWNRIATTFSSIAKSLNISRAKYESVSAPEKALIDI